MSLGSGASGALEVMLIISSDGITGSVSDVEQVRLCSQAIREGGPEATERAGRLSLEQLMRRCDKDLRRLS